MLTRFGAYGVPDPLFDILQNEEECKINRGFLGR
jgi:hypothetical protein